MLQVWIDRLGDWNPQLFRELKGRLNQRSLLATLIVSAIFQAILIKLFCDQLPGSSTSWAYCQLDGLNQCLRDGAGNPVILWQKWWLDMFRVVNWAVPFILMLPGVYLLITDLDREERRGTLNFIRLSPQSGSSILHGKLLGVPILVYLGVLSLLPLHLLAALGSGTNLGFLVSYYAILLATTYVVYSSSFLFGFLGRFQSIAAGNQTTSVGVLYILAVLLIYLPIYFVWNLGTTWRSFSLYWIPTAQGESDALSWFFLPLSSNSAAAHLFVFANLFLINHWIWLAINRSYQTPHNTLLAKSHSYGLVVYSQLLMLGFSLQLPDPNIYNPRAPFIAVALVDFILFLALSGLLSPQRQALLDWARYRHLNQPGLAGWWRDMLLGERSPAVVAIVANLGIAAAILLPWILGYGLTSQPGEFSRRLVYALALVGMFSLLALYAVTIQRLLLLKTAKRAALALAVVMLLVIAPLALAVITSSSFSIGHNWILLFSPFLWMTVGYISPSIIGGSILLQWLMLAMANLQLMQHLNRLGESASKPLLSATAPLAKF